MGSKVKILIADDEPDVLRLLEGILTSSGFDLVKATNGKEAVEQVSQEHPDLVLLDIGMPELNGFETCERLRKEKNNETLPILMLTARDRESDIVQALEAGADDYVMKPFERTELLNKINSLLSRAKTRMLPSQLRKTREPNPPEEMME